MTGVLLVLVYGLFGAAAIIGLVTPRARVARTGALAAIALGGVAAIALSAMVLAGADEPVIVVASGLPLGSLHLGLDPLAAVFLALLGVVLVPAMIYADGYLALEEGHAPIRSHLALLALLALSITLVLTATDGVTFLVGWELLAWSSFLSAVLDVDDRATARAAYLMLAVSQLGSFGLVAAILALGGGHFEFAALAAGGSALGEPARSLVFIGLLVGFGAKAGLLPLQLWLPEAHPAAPSHVSALLSAVIVKLGLYGLIRFALDILGQPAPWWGPLLIVVGGVTAVVGILWALFQADLKRVLAYSTIENVGIIVATIGLAETFRADGLAPMAAITLVVALYAIVAHGLAKSLLFLAAGAVDRATGTRQLDRLGGLLRRMPVTASAALLGCLSIAAVAPFAGYLAEWQVLETYLQGFRLTLIADRVVVAATGALLALTAATAVMVFVRLFGIAFVGLPRSAGADDASEGPRSMRLAMSLLAAALVALGFLPTLVLTVLDRAAAGIVGPSILPQLVPPVFGNLPDAYAALVALGGRLFAGLLPVQGLIIIPSPVFSTINSPTYLTLAELGLLAVVGLAVRLVPRMAADRRAPVWAGGIPRFRPSMQYSAVAYANPVRLIFAVVLGSRTTASRPRAAVGETGAVAYAQDVPAPLERWVYGPVLSVVDRLARGVKVVQSGDVNQYVAYIFVIVLLVLLLRVV
ncbi:MAG TPA: proton-conducting transporter membrane subunit [Candidatus Sulfotelmatobacter sp.]|nr:proton-conducting transporter membrane subunit [Candidatus Sulfotelmatobacter sp.]